MSATLGTISPSPMSRFFGTGYEDFSSPFGISGLAKINGRRLDLLAVIAASPGHGQFRRFILSAQDEYDTVCVWLVHNPSLQAALPRYGFTPESELQGDGEVLDGFRWDSPPIP